MELRIWKMPTMSNFWGHDERNCGASTGQKGENVGMMGQMSENVGGGDELMREIGESG